MNQFSVAHLSDKELLAAASKHAATQREATAALVAALAEIEDRSLHLAGGYDSIYGYCREVLRLSEHATYARIEAARACRDFPVILDLLASGALTLTTVGLLRPVLNDDNHASLLANACYRSKREVGQQRSRRFGRPHQRQLPVFSSQSPPARYMLQFTVMQETHDRLRIAQDLLRHQVPDGDLAAIFDKALAALIKAAERRKWAATDNPHDREPRTEWTRHIPAAVRRAVLGNGTAASAPSSAPMAAAAAARCSSSITWIRSPSAERPRLRTSNSGAALTTSTRRSCFSARRSAVRRRSHLPKSVRTELVALRMPVWTTGMEGRAGPTRAAWRCC